MSLINSTFGYATAAGAGQGIDSVPPEERKGCTFSLIVSLEKNNQKKSSSGVNPCLGFFVLFFVFVLLPHALLAFPQGFAALATTLKATQGPRREGGFWSFTCMVSGGGAWGGAFS